MARSTGSKPYGPWPGGTLSRRQLGSILAAHLREFGRALADPERENLGQGRLRDHLAPGRPVDPVELSAFHVRRGGHPVCRHACKRLFPRTRLRQNVSGFHAHYVPGTKTTARLSYRVYFDDYDVRAHTVLAEVYQALGDRVLFGALYRLLRQNAVNFWTTSLTVAELEVGGPRTADSDLAEFWAHKWGAKLLFHVTPPGCGRQHDIDLFFNRYTRTSGPSGQRPQRRLRLQIVSPNMAAVAICSARASGSDKDAAPCVPVRSKTIGHETKSGSADTSGGATSTIDGCCPTLPQSSRRSP